MPKSVLTNADTRMSKAIDSLKREFSVLRTGRASAALLDNIQVDYYGMPTPINQMAQITVPEARQLVIKPYDKSMLSAIERSINEANIGLTPNNDGEVIRLNVRRDANDEFKKLQKNGEITEDALKGYTEDVQKLTDKKIKEVDAVADEKEKDIMSI